MPSEIDSSMMTSEQARNYTKKCKLKIIERDITLACQAGRNYVKYTDFDAHFGDVCSILTQMGYRITEENGVKEAVFVSARKETKISW